MYSDYRVLFAYKKIKIKIKRLKGFEYHFIFIAHFVSRLGQNIFILTYFDALF